MHGGAGIAGPKAEERRRRCGGRPPEARALHRGYAQERKELNALLREVRRGVKLLEKTMPKPPKAAELQLPDSADKDGAGTGPWC